MSKQARREYNPMNTAFAIIQDRIAATPEYKAAYAAVVATVAETVKQNPSVEQMKALGGWTKLIHSTIDSFESCAVVSENRGSKLIPMSIAHVLRNSDMSDFRYEAMKLAFGAQVGRL
jgi:hypothetical protein